MIAPPKKRALLFSKNASWFFIPDPRPSHEQSSTRAINGLPHGSPDRTLLFVFVNTDGVVVMKGSRLGGKLEEGDGICWRR